MSSLKHAAWTADEQSDARTVVRQWAGAALQRASAMLGRLALRLSAEPVPRAPADPHFEYHAEAGAPEGALYVDGCLVGWLRGVKRL